MIRPHSFPTVYLLFLCNTYPFLLFSYFSILPFYIPHFIPLPMLCSDPHRINQPDRSSNVLELG